MTRSWNLLLLDDHETTEKMLAAVELAFSQPDGPAPELIGTMLTYLVEYVDRCHNAKEELHLFPLIEARGIPRDGGPLAVMLLEHEQSRVLLGRLTPLAQAYAEGDRSVREDLRRTLEEYATLITGHFWKENDILYPMALRVMEPGDGEAVVRGIAAVEASFGPDTRERYYKMAADIVKATALPDLSRGLDPDVLAAILNTLPVEVSFVDADDRVRYFSHENQDKIFPRTRGAIGTAVQDCHPQHSVEKVEEILRDFRSGRRAVAEFWIDMNGKKIHIRYFPVRDRDGRYLGCAEVVQDITAIQMLTGQQRLLDPA